MDSEIEKLIDFYTNREMIDWFRPSDAFDTALKAYAPLVERARRGELDHLESTPDGCLALLILLDQIPRNIFRGSEQAFASDNKAYHIAVRAIAKDFHKQVRAKKRMNETLLYLPLLHAEDLAAQVGARALYGEMMLECPKDSPDYFMCTQGLVVAERHLKCVLENGRFPGRNQALGRESSEKETAWLQQHPQGF